MYRNYLLNDDQTAQLGSKTKTPSAAVALRTSAALAGRVDLDGHPVTAVLSCNGALMALHRFDGTSGLDEPWHTSLPEGDWPDEQLAKPGSDGARANAGHRGKTTDGGPIRPYPASLDMTSWQILVAYGNGKLSEGIRRAARARMPSEE